MRLPAIILIVVSFVRPLPSSAELTADDLRTADDHGYSDPADDQSIFDYRLPDWRWRNTELGLDFTAANQSSEAGGDSDEQTLADLRLRGQITWNHESEQNDLRYSLSNQDRYLRLHSERDDETGRNTQTRTTLESSLVGNLDWFRYVAGDFAILTRADVFVFYDEQELDREDESQGVDEQTLAVRRRANLRGDLGAAWGRIRKVTPVIRAERVAERIVALGRPRPSRANVLRLADAFAQRGSFEIVYERPDKFFWPPLLDELAGERPFTPLEVLYLIEVFEETLFVREQGFRTTTFGQIERITGTGLSSSTYRALALELEWAHNLDLRHQVGVRASIERGVTDRTDLSDDTDEETITFLHLEANHIWDVADRINVRSEASYRRGDVENEISPGTRDIVTTWYRLGVTADFFVEDRWSLRPSLRWDHSTSEVEITDFDPMENEGTNFGASLALVYHWDHLAD